MIKRLIAASFCMALLSGFTAEEKQRAITACAGSLATAKAQGRGIPDAAIKDRVKICTCIADGIAKDTTIPPSDRQIILQMYELGAKGDFTSANQLQKTVSRATPPVMGKISRECTAPYRRSRS